MGFFDVGVLHPLWQALIRTQPTVTELIIITSFIGLLALYYHFSKD